MHTSRPCFMLAAVLMFLMVLCRTCLLPAAPGWPTAGDAVHQAGGWGVMMGLGTEWGLHALVQIAPKPTACTAAYGDAGRREPEWAQGVVQPSRCTAG